ncbi:MAG: 16S rRNA (guanine(966)-N(2))-methyltransferase RsmD [Rhizobiales bacterium]|nr:16S rRNA (guanine(966)-N(2))-methyltransferase RsmD [Hyphomicrobiales bacterium]
MRIVAGRYRGRELKSPSDSAVRPTGDRIREALFNILLNGRDPVSIEGARVLDLFAGTGALGLEALSRGAVFCLFVEENSDARALVRENVERLAATGIAKIFRRDATTMGDPGSMRAFDLVFLDPPYRKGLGEKALASALAGGWLTTGARIVWEEAADAEVAIPDGFEVIDERTWGETTVRFLSLRTAGPAGDPPRG